MDLSTSIYLSDFSCKRFITNLGHFLKEESEKSTTTNIKQAEDFISLFYSIINSLKLSQLPFLDLTLSSKLNSSNIRAYQNYFRCILYTSLVTLLVFDSQTPKGQQAQETAAYTLYNGIVRLFIMVHTSLFFLCSRNSKNWCLFLVFSAIWMFPPSLKYFHFFLYHLSRGCFPSVMNARRIPQPFSPTSKSFSMNYNTSFWKRIGRLQWQPFPLTPKPSLRSPRRFFNPPLCLSSPPSPPYSLRLTLNSQRLLLSLLFIFLLVHLIMYYQHFLYPISTRLFLTHCTLNLRPKHPWVIHFRPTTLIVFFAVCLWFVDATPTTPSSNSISNESLSVQDLKPSPILPPSTNQSHASPDQILLMESLHHPSIETMPSDSPSLVEDHSFTDEIHTAIQDLVVHSSTESAAILPPLSSTKRPFPDSEPPAVTKIQTMYYFFSMFISSDPFYPDASKAICPKPMEPNPLNSPTPATESVVEAVPTTNPADYMKKNGVKKGRRGRKKMKKETPSTVPPKSTKPEVSPSEEKSDSDESMIDEDAGYQRVLPPYLGKSYRKLKNIQSQPIWDPNQLSKKDGALLDSFLDTLTSSELMNEFFLRVATYKYNVTAAIQSVSPFSSSHSPLVYCESALFEYRQICTWACYSICQWYGQYSQYLCIFISTGSSIASSILIIKEIDLKTLMTSYIIFPSWSTKIVVVSAVFQEAVCMNVLPVLVCSIQDVTNSTFIKYLFSLLS